MAINHLPLPRAIDEGSSRQLSSTSLDLCLCVALPPFNRVRIISSNDIAASITASAASIEAPTTLIAVAMASIALIEALVTILFLPPPLYLTYSVMALRHCRCRVQPGHRAATHNRWYWLEARPRHTVVGRTRGLRPGDCDVGRFRPIASCCDNAGLTRLLSITQSSLHLNTNASITTLGTETIHAPTPKPPWMSPFSTVHIHDASKLRQAKSTSIQNMAWRLGPSMI